MRIKACIESLSLIPAVMEIVVCEGGLEVVVDRVGGGCYGHVDSDSGLGGTKMATTSMVSINNITTPSDVRWKYASLAVRKLETRGEAGGRGRNRRNVGGSSRPRTVGSIAGANGLTAVSEHPYTS